MPPSDLSKQSKDYQRIEKAIHILEETAFLQPDLKKLSTQLNLSEYHFQRLFSRWAGVSPKRFLQFLTLEHAKSVLDKSRNLLDATLDSGLSSVSRLHDLFLQCESVTPGEYKSRGEGLTISYGFHPSPFGECLLATTENGICGLTFIQNGDRDNVMEFLSRRWKQASLKKEPRSTGKFMDQIFSKNPDRKTPLYLYVKGTNFQIKVWEALVRIPQGALVSYQDVARYLGRPKSSRAVANAVANNPIQYLVPCHRVIQGMGAFGGYQAGPDRKKALVAWEAAQIQEELA
ncbi:MAG: methylated-DNA--[protein]-cysteine S-methyltransferase [Candidatus Nitronauta litoralis]|uniref:methylated-DNA--[protein]-cysteine S-methyltransferase n=1 Tax=Candidatus Nitronauta litoralis TaxID=2705533 RepID=A0A7T0BV67_9BACT|nr:MAG: methylated-DNA--[protein]-cysteine S-methyltransferase [Candidatus Nitronauta litoralis]